MALPKKLNPDNLKDTLVEIRYIQGIPQELTLGFALSVLAPLGFQYTAVPNQGLNISLDNNQQVQLGFGNPNIGGFFIKEDVRIQFVANTIVFNCLADKYVLWEKYFSLISSVLDSLYKQNIIKAFNRVSLRYVSEFKNIDIFRNIKGNIDVSDTNLKLDNSILRLVDESQNMKTFVTLTNKAKRISQTPQGQQIIEASLIDINVFENIAPAISNLEIVKTKLNEIHTKQKETFFGLITDNFCKSLSPEY